MIKKIINYYKSFGFIELIKKIKRYIIFSTNNGTYRIRKKEKKYIVLKNKKIYIFTYYNYRNIDIRMRDFLNQLNQLGFQIIYIYIEKKSKEKLLPLSVYKNILKINFNDISFSNKDIVLLHGYYKEFENIYSHIKNSQCKVFSIKDGKLNKNIDYKKANKYFKVICLDRSSIKEQCDIYWEESYNYFIETNSYPKFFENISVIVLNYNNKKIIEKCIDSLLKYNHRYKYEIIVVDNQSQDGSYELIKRKYKNIKVLRNSKNGCSSGRNLGVANSSKEYVIFLDSDQWVTNDFWLDNYIEVLSSNSSVGAVGWAGGWFNKKGLAYHTFENFEYRYMPPQGLYRSDIGYLGSGGLMMSKKLFKKIKGFDLNYDPTCYEDTDLSVNIRHHKKEIVYCPYLGIEHNPHQTTKSGSHIHDILIKEKGYYFVKKWKKINPKLLDYCK